jgi:NAD(P)-dependent dehydrogenase (short-subunit alcohol dehydrogenase family)
MPEEEWVTVIDTNLNGPWRMAHACSPIMIKKRWGRIINVVSPSGILGMAMVPAYGTSKGALMAFTRHLASELGRFGITVNGLCPGVVATDTFVGFFTEEGPKGLGAALPLGRPTLVEDLVGALLLLASDAGVGMTGGQIYVDGGMSNCAAMPPTHIEALQGVLGAL